MTPSNQQRANRCQTMLAAYGDDMIESNLIDFLADAMHWCDANSGDFHIALGVRPSNAFGRSLSALLSLEFSR